MNHRFQPDSHFKFDLAFHPSQEQLEALEDGELPPRERRRVLSHLDGCARCRQARHEQARAMGVARDELLRHPRIVSPPGFDARVWESIEARRLEREQAMAPFGARLGAFLLRPIPRLFGSAMFGLLSALAFGHLAASVPSASPDSPPISVALPVGADDADASLAALYAMEQRRFRSPGDPQVLVPAPVVGQPSQNSPQRRSQENFLWPNPPRPSRAASSLDAGSWC